MTAPARLLLYTRNGCHLCEDMAEAVRPLLAAHGLTLALTDVDADPVLRARYGLRVPVLALDGEVVCEGRLDESALRDALRIP